MSLVSHSFVVEDVPIDSLVLDPANPRQIDAAMLDALSASVREFGMVQPVIARRVDRTIIAGHQRLVAARREGHRTVPVHWLDLSPERARLLGLALNRISGTWDEDLLARMLADLGMASDLDVTLSGFDEDAVDALVRRLDRRERRTRVELFDHDAAVAAATTSSRTRRGDLWRLGDHRLLVGDATIAADVERVLDGGRADLVFTDPPYNVALGDHGGQQRGSRRRRIENDALSADAWDAFVHAWSTNLLAVADGAIYICMSGKEWPTLCATLAELGGHWSTTIVWAKDRFTLGRSDYQRGYEPIWYGWRKGADHHWCGDRDQSDVWRIDRPSASELHPTTKPIELVERAILNSSGSGGLVLDPFVGSGSTIIAAERTGRRCAAIEIDPIYAATAIARWERFTDGTAERLGDAASGASAAGVRLLPATVRS
jgi:DNA modification methylase